MDGAKKRLSALSRYNRLGAGFQIALRDLELRGAGNLLGTRQSGFIAGVGFDLYCQLLRQSINRLKGGHVAPLIRATLRLDCIVLGSGGQQALESRSAPSAQAEAEDPASIAEAFLPTDYIPETALRIHFYRQISLAESLEGMDELAEALADRFGPCPAPVSTLIAVTRLRCMAEQKGIQLIETRGAQLKMLRNSGKKDDYIQYQNRFPRLIAQKPLAKIEEICNYLINID